MLPLAHLLCKLFVLLAHLECGRLCARIHVRGCSRTRRCLIIVQYKHVCVRVEGRGGGTRRCDGATARGKEMVQVSEILDAVACDDDDMASGAYHLELGVGG